MRCVNCGWNNPDGITKCQKCNQPLPVVPVSNEKKTNEKLKPDVSYQATMRDVTRINHEEKRATKRMTDEVLDRPKPTGHEEETDRKCLKLVSLENEETINCDSFPFVVKRDSCKSFGVSVDAQSQAELTMSDGSLFIEDKSGSRNTYVLASRKIKLEEGDIVVMGGKRFIVG